MACCTPTANAELSRDPSGTRQLREDFVDEVARRFDSLKARIRSKIGYENDALHLMGDAPGSMVMPTGNADDDRDRFEFVNEEDLVATFVRWLREAVRREVIEPADNVAQGDHWTAPYLKSAYGKGWQQATGRLMQQGVSVTPEDDIQTALQLPVARRQLQKLYTRAFENLQGITEVIGQELRDTLTEGLAAGWNPRKMARRLAERVDAIEAKRARTIARTETLYSHNEAALDRYERAGVETVQHGEWATADDSRVCPICETLEGKVYTISEMRTGTFQFDAPGDVPDSLAGSYPLHPPAHPNGRCIVLPVIGTPDEVVANARSEGSDITVSDGVRELASGAQPAAA